MYIIYSHLSLFSIPDSERVGAIPLDLQIISSSNKNKKKIFLPHGEFYVTKCTP